MAKGKRKGRVVTKHTGSSRAGRRVSIRRLIWRMMDICRGRVLVRNHLSSREGVGEGMVPRLRLLGGDVVAKVGGERCRWQYRWPCL